MSPVDTLGGFVLDASALAALGGGENIYATAWADQAAVRGVVLLVPSAALSEAWQHIRRHLDFCTFGELAGWCRGGIGVSGEVRGLQRGVLILVGG